MSTTIFNHIFHIEQLLRKVAGHISFSFDPIASFCAVFVVVIAFLQWRAVRKQYKQNMFKMRLEHYTKVKHHLNILLDFQTIQNILLNQENKNNDEFNEAIKKINEAATAALIEAGELNYLFGKKAGTQWSEFFNSAYKLANTISLKTSEEDINKELSELNKKQIKIINLFTNKLNL